MAIYLSSEISPGDTLAFDSLGDSLVFDLTGYSAGDFSITQLPGDAGVQWSDGWLTFTLEGVALSDLSEDNVQFANGSKLVTSCNANGHATDLSGTALDDQFIGSPITVAAGWTLRGGAGDDVYQITNAADTIVEASDEGDDVIFASVSFALPANVEQLVLTGSASVNGQGNGLDNRLTGNAQANRLDGGAGGDAMTGGAGDDIYVVDSVHDVVVEDEGGGHDSLETSIQLSLPNWVEDLTLTGSAALTVWGNFSDNRIEGNQANNQLSGEGGADTLIGGGGEDLLAGGSGDDVYVIDSESDDIVEEWNDDIDTVYSSISYKLPRLVEVLVLTGEGDLTGEGRGGDRLVGNAGDNLLMGASTMEGGLGNDTLYISSPTDQVVELAGGGIDTIRSSAPGFILPDNVENLQLVLVGEATNGTGNALANTITGSDEANVLSGGAGADTLIGGAGNDTYGVENVGDVVRESAAGGTDLVRSSVSFQLPSGVENLTLTGSAAINGTGNALANTIIGNSAANVLGGGAGADLLTGDAGNDTYIVDNAADRAIEVAGGGNDLIKSFITFQLPSEVESLTLLGASAINGTGNALANLITGNAAANVLGGGAGADTLTGGSGNDTYVVDNAGDKTVELAGGGVDLTRSFIGFVLQAEVENLELLGTEAINGAGNSLANTLKGNSAANVLTGGAGADTLTGGAGSDTFTLNSTLGSDLITDFAHASDKLRITQSMLRVGDGDTVIEGGVSVAGPNGFASGAELVIVTHDIAGGITATSAAAAIGHADSAYAVGDTRLFVVDNGSDSAVYLFKAANADSTISASELTLLATLDNAANTTLTDYLFGA